MDMYRCNPCADTYYFMLSHKVKSRHGAIQNLKTTKTIITTNFNQRLYNRATARFNANQILKSFKFSNLQPQKRRQV